MRNKIVTSCLVGVGMLAVTGMSFAQTAIKARYGSDSKANPSKPDRVWTTRPVKSGRRVT